MTTRNVVTDEQLGALARRQNDLFRRVREGTLPAEPVLRGLQGLIEGKFDRAPQGLRHLIDCDAPPHIPHGWDVEEHRKGGLILFDPAKTILYLDEDQKNSRIVIYGNVLRRLIADKPVMNACVLDHLLANTDLIPEEWKQDENGDTPHIYFWGTVYRGYGGHLYVRCLSWEDGRWHCRSYSLEQPWTVRCLAAIMAGS